MDQAEKILIQYAQADFSQRINLFLQLPDLRDAFQEIERSIVSCSTDFFTLNCTAEQRKIFCATIVPQSNHRYREIENI
jgi:hypothetical protein